MSPAMAQCCEDYTARKKECADLGLDPGAIARNVANDMRVSQGMCLVKVRAYKPTGVALGCPLPSPGFQQRLHDLIAGTNAKLMALTGTGRCIALVPGAFLHVTLVNRDHFDHRDDGSGVKQLGPREHRRIAAVIRDLRLGPVEVGFKGWQLTRSGRFLALGFPCGDALFQLRAALIHEIPALRAHPPSTAHIKIAHLLACLDQSKLGGFLDWMDSVSPCIDQTLVFEDVYTPLGRIRLAS